LLNEINSENSAVLEEKTEYLELIAVNCGNNAAVSLNDYSIIVVKEFDDSVKNPVILMSVDLKGKGFKTNTKFYVIGSRNTSVQPNLTFDDASVMYVGNVSAAGFQLPAKSASYQVFQ
jgi:hypothetical protein